MRDSFTADFFAGNRVALRKQLPPGAFVVMTAHGLMQLSADASYPFHQDSNFWYLTGLNEPDLILVMDGDDEYIIVPGRSGSREAFEGAINVAGLAAVSGIPDVRTDDEGWKQLGADLKKRQQVHGLLAPDSYIEQYGMYTNPARARLLDRLKSWNTQLEIEDTRMILANLRMIKQPREIEAIQKAIDVTIAGLEYVIDPKQSKTFTYEFEIENELTKKFRTRESDGHAFSPIVASGKRAVTLHNIENSAPLEQNTLLVLDVGAEVSHYAADITRTIAIGKPSQRQRDVYDAVLAIQDYALSLLKPGVLLKEFETAVESYLGGKLQELGLIETADREAIRKYYPHAASHFLGLDTHDAGDYSRPLEEGTIITCEPGIYIPGEGIGVRIEDDVLITENGNKVLSAELPRSLTA